MFTRAGSANDQGQVGLPDLFSASADPSPARLAVGQAGKPEVTNEHIAAGGGENGARNVDGKEGPADSELSAQDGGGGPDQNRAAEPHREPERRPQQPEERAED